MMGRLLPLRHHPQAPVRHLPLQRARSLHEGMARLLQRKRLQHKRARRRRRRKQKQNPKQRQSQKPVRSISHRLKMRRRGSDARLRRSKSHRRPAGRANSSMTRLLGMDPAESRGVRRHLAGSVSLGFTCSDSSHPPKWSASSKRNAAPSKCPGSGDISVIL